MRKYIAYLSKYTAYLSVMLDVVAAIEAKDYKGVANILAQLFSKITNIDVDISVREKASRNASREEGQ